MRTPTVFLRIRALATPRGVFSFGGYGGVCGGYLDTMTVFYVLAVANLVNFGLDLVLVLWLRMGPVGAAIATTVAEWIAAVGFLAVLGGILPSGMENGELERRRRRRRRQTPNDGGKPAANPTIITPTSSHPPPSSSKRHSPKEPPWPPAPLLPPRHPQIALQFFLLGSFVCDALAAASQALVSDALGREDVGAVRSVSRVVLEYALGLGVVLGLGVGVGITFGGDGSGDGGFLVGLFTKDEEVRAVLGPLLGVLVITQPLNSLVFAADGVLQGASEFEYQAKAMVVSVVIAVGGGFDVFEYLG